MTRDARSIGAGLAPPRDPRPIPAGERLHVLGVAGAGASAAAMLGHHAGAVVTGCDPGGPSPYTPALEAVGIPLAWAHDAAHVTTSPRPARLAVTKALTAIDPDHPELRAAHEAAIPTEPWQQVVADAAVGRRLIAIAGTHGKSTSAGWLVHVLAEAGLDPSAFVGALLPGSLTGGVPGTARWGRGDAFVVEADEYAGNFDPYRPDVAVVTGAEWDHPDVFADRDAVVAAFSAWLRGVRPGGVVIVNVGDPGGAAIAEGLVGTGLRVVAAALVDQPPSASRGLVRGIAERYATRAGRAEVLLGRIVQADRDGTDLEVHGLDPLAGPVVARLASAGRHNAINALGVVGAAIQAGASPDAIVAALGSFPGVGRRLERKGEAAGVVIYDDYGHHPTALRETIGAIRQREPGRRLWAVYEPLTFHRTAALLQPFAEALASADAVVIADIWAGRDLDRTVASAAGLADAVAQVRPSLHVAAPGDVEATTDHLATHVRDGDAVLVMGGGHSYRIASGLLTRLSEAGTAGDPH
ncbi:UDP-N-acetylmuramate--L-alanine ligase [soil metagenome]